jgi:hypothetical protein
MATALELAVDVLPHFAKHVVAGQVRSYAVYANAIGRDPAKESMLIGKAMHIIGAVCVFAAIPIAPLHYVTRSDGEWRGVFQADPNESLHVLPHYDLLYVVARAYKYSEEDFERIDNGLRNVLPKHLPPDYISPHHVWHWVIYTKLKDGRTVFERALARYSELREALRNAKA